MTFRCEKVLSLSREHEQAGEDKNRYFDPSTVFAHSYKESMCQAGICKDGNAK